MLSRRKFHFFQNILKHVLYKKYYFLVFCEIFSWKWWIQIIFRRRIRFLVEFYSNTSQKVKITQNTTSRHQYFLNFFRYNSNILPFFRTKYRHIYIKKFVIIQPTIFMQNDFNITCYYMLKYVKYTFFMKFWLF